MGVFRKGQYLKKKKKKKKKKKNWIVEFFFNLHYKTVMYYLNRGEIRIFFNSLKNYILLTYSFMSFQ
jgi:hypothetical protein